MFKCQKSNKKRGFSFVELMIAVSIFGLLSILSISSYSKFNNRIGVDTLSYQIAQFGHEAQVSALSVKRTYGGTFPGYGLHFESASTTQFVFFADLNGNGMYDPNGTCGIAGAECEKIIKLLKGVTIKALCGKSSVGIDDSANCKTSGIEDGSLAYDITFKRPNPDANILGKASSTAPMTDFSKAEIVIASNKGYIKRVQFYITGQITVK